ncbi:MAG TPA: flagellar hook capping FlgD N-terminal domain-containing protein [Rubrivivax sp.]|jgi:flagellar basal-body rod modification protein FlgD|nr:flagellar hook assembly protein FlgD [Rhodoferax sp.]MCL4737917.1 flagellar hook assembly protein FlgD [Burkholderiaceae bacterium]MCP5288606.1 flagellar hook assembly protein FlgD [Burkholderiaceae bacterium]HMQ71746.1 flagellar hook capping FlgD N-terminal domain-containing protein [Rubrivivax sp.]HMR69036.1 flagellar hook capping FlgD N-terminal domain-containing protein [Rubrivivax sp.]
MSDISSLDALGSSTGSAASAGVSDAGSADRFLKLLVTQLQNQDPLNPMDNAEITSQMAQINTVSGIERLNTGLQGLTAQVVQMQALQGAALVGRDVTVAGDRLAAVDGGAQGGFALAGPADRVQVEILNAAGVVVDTLDLGALGSGRHGFAWDGEGAEALSGHRFRVSASQGASEVTATPLMLDHVRAVGIDGAAGLTLDLQHSGQVAWGDVVAMN